MNKQKRSVNSIALLMILLAIIAVCTHLIPSGAYESKSLDVWSLTLLHLPSLRTKEPLFLISFWPFQKA